MPVLPQKRSSLFFTTVLITVIALMLALLISILREGQELHEFVDKQREPAVQASPSSSQPPQVESRKTSPPAPRRSASAAESKQVMTPAPDFEPSGTEEQGE